MLFLQNVHAIFGERVLPVLIIAAAAWFTVTWKPDAERTVAARVFTILVSIQFLLGLIVWIYRVIVVSPALYLGFPFILHPILGTLAVVIAHMAVNPRGRMARLGRWAPLVSMAVLLLVVMGAIVIAVA